MFVSDHGSAQAFEVTSEVVVPAADDDAARADDFFFSACSSGPRLPAVFVR